MISHYDSLTLIVRHVTFFSKQLRQFDMKLCPPHGFCDPLRWWLAVWCRNSYLTRVLWLLHTWWFMVFAWSLKSSVPFSGYVNTAGGKRAQTFCVDDCVFGDKHNTGSFDFPLNWSLSMTASYPSPSFPLYLHSFRDVFPASSCSILLSPVGTHSLCVHSDTVPPSLANCVLETQSPLGVSCQRQRLFSVWNHSRRHSVH